jgi:putative ATP-binding cassette transporter
MPETDGLHPTIEEDAAELRMSALLVAAVRLLKPVWLLAALAGGLGIVGGLIVAGLLAQINGALGAEGGAATTLLLALGGLIVVAIGMSLGSEICNTVVGQRVVARLRRDLCRRVVATPLERIESITPQHLMAVLTADLDALSGITLSLAPLMVAAATTLAVFGYLAWLSPILFAAVAVAVVLGGIANARARREGLKRMDMVWEAHEDVLKNFRMAVDGGKELRMNRRRRHTLLERRLVGAIDRITGLQIRMRRQFGIADAIASALLWGTVLLVLAVEGWIGRGTAGAFILALLFVHGPMEQLLGALPLLSRGEIALRRISALSNALGDYGGAGDGSSSPAMPDFARIDVRGVTYTYSARDGQDAVHLGPYDLEVRRGEILFITGENGAGKSTLLKLLTGLYEPVEGRVELDGRTVDAASMAGYRELFSTVFYDFHLFDELVLPGDLQPGEIEEVLARLKLSHKVTVEEGRLSTTDLSAGQRRRLALLQVYLDRRPIVVLDEWAAEQDPIFRRNFYTALLPEMKARGATIVAVSHDDRYFHVADRCLLLGEDGRFVDLPPPSPAEAGGGENGAKPA